jgi:putative NIF3 family GTP cyclohydrolase 1 type 2
VALCGGSGSFLIPKAIENGADAFITADLKYHDFFEAEGKTLLVDAGHFETEIPAVEQLTNILQEKFPTFAVLKTKVNTNPVNYFRN